jgi:hypothetical protein
MLYNVGILGIIENYYTSKNDREAFDLYIDCKSHKLYLYNEIISIVP